MCAKRGSEFGGTAGYLLIISNGVGPGRSDDMMINHIVSIHTHATYIAPKGVRLILKNEQQFSSSTAAFPCPPPFFF